jgi:D-alanine-D-alanine ligase
VKKLRIGIIYGGRSGEHEVSMASAASVIKHLNRSRYEPIPIRIEKDGRWTLADKAPTATSAADVLDATRAEAGRPQRPQREAHLVAHPCTENLLTIDRRERVADGNDREASAIVNGISLDVVFPLLHGPYGEDGTVQGLLELANIAYVGAGVLGSAAGMDKAVMKTLFASRGLPIVRHLVVRQREWTAEANTVVSRVSESLGFPVFVKPANLGSSVGISKVTSAAQLAEAVECALQFDRKIVIEAAVPRPREIECAVLGNDEPQASVPGEVIPSREFYDYEAKYLDDGSRVVIPAPIGEAQAESIRRLSIEAFQAVEGAGLSRVDFLLAGDTGAIFLNEVNTIPGFTTISMYPKLWEASGVPYPDLLDRLVALAIERHAEKQRLRTSIT